MHRRIALFGGSFNPPGLHHRHIAETLLQAFDEVRIIPCGPRSDKPEVNNIPSSFRAALCDMTFGDLEKVKVDLFDLEQESFTTNIRLQKRFEQEGELWHVVGADWLGGGCRNESLIHRTWAEGPRLWKEANFAVLTRPGHQLDPCDLPPNHQLFTIELADSSTIIRQLRLHGESARHLLTPRSADYIERYGLYRGTIPSSWSRGSLTEWNAMLHMDRQNPKAIKWSEELASHVCQTDPDFVMVLGGDGMMLKAIRNHWRKRLPFFGINAGNLGFLMNAPEQVFSEDFPPNDIIFRQLPLLFIEMETPEGQIKTAYAFNDAWVERKTSQSAWLNVEVNGVERIPKLVSDGLLVATAAGSTAYARSMGASPLLADTPAWLLVGSNVMEPAQWKSALLSSDSQISVTNLSEEKRPIIAFVDGIAQGPVKSIRARLSRAATVELAFLANRDMAEKIASIQFLR